MFREENLNKIKLKPKKLSNSFLGKISKNGYIIFRLYFRS
jgi:hypothetical protein